MADVTALIRQLCDIMAGGPKRLEDVTSHLGGTVVESGDDRVAVLRDPHPGVAKMTVFRQQNKSEPRSITLELSEPSTLFFSDLSQAFGQYKRVVPHNPEDRCQFVFKLASTEKPFNCDLIAAAVLASNKDDEMITTVTIRRVA